MTEFSIKKVWIVAKREYLERVRTRSFLLSTFVTPFLMATFLVLPTLISTSAARGIMRENERPARVVIVSDNRALAELASGELQRQHGTPYAPSVVTPASPAERARLDKQLNQSDIEGYVWLDGPAIASRQVTFTTRRMGDFILRGRLSDALSYALAAQRMVKQGSTAGDVAEILQPVDLTAVRAGNPSSVYNEVRGAVVVFILMFVMLFSLLSYGVMVMRSVMEEKSSRITEVLMCAASAQELMAGKILGTGSVGLTQIGLWLTMVGVGVSRSLYLRTAMNVLDVGPSLIIYFVVFYTLGYLLYSAIFAGVGAIFNSIDEAQQWNFVVVLPLIAASAMILPVATSSDSLISVVASLFPFCSPILMFERLAVHDPPVWQTALSLILLIATIAGVMFLSARIYRTGILMYGKRPTIRELSRWLRHA
jgi:ABC-2 type transport system permease protein